MARLLRDRINEYGIMIFRLNAGALKKEYVEILQSFSDLIDGQYRGSNEMIALKNELLRTMAEKLQSNDFIKMADALKAQILPLVSDLMDAGNPERIKKQN